jgi:hypothetical protein
MPKRSFTDRVLDALGTSAIALEVILFELPQLVWWPVLVAVRWFHPRQLTRDEVQVLVVKCAARVLSWPAIPIARRWSPELAELLVIYFATSAIVWIGLIWWLL